MNRHLIPGRRIAATFALACVLFLLTAAASGQNLDVGNWQIEQANSTSSFTIPAGTSIPPGGYLVLGRFADKASFEAFHGVSLGANVVYLTNASEAPAVPMINGDETYTLKNAGGTVVDGPTPQFNTSFTAHHRTDPESSPWNLIDDTPSPGSGVEAADGVFSGLVISEAADGDGSGNYIYEFVELYYDADTGSGGNRAPVISGTDHAPAAPGQGDDVTVNAQITDSDGAIAQARCYYRFGGVSFAYEVMSNTGGDQYEATLTNVPGDVTLEYYIWAEDDEGAAGSDPAGAPGTLHSVWITGLSGPAKVILFDHAHDQDAGSNGNWRIDDNFPDPLPTVPASETSWNGQLSSWAYELYLLGHSVRSSTALLSPAVLGGVDMLVIPEPQNPFTAAEIEAVRQFVFDGGSLFFVTDHNSSDRNGNGWDSPSIFGGYSQPHISVPVGSDVETFCGALFGLHVHVKDEGNNSISGTYTNVNGDPANPVIHGDFGDVASVVYHVGNVMSLWPTANPHLSDVGGIVSKDAGSPHLAAWSRYGQGKVFGFGDSSDMADGTGSEPHVNNWLEADHRALFLNASLWLLAGGVSGVDEPPTPFGLDLSTYPNPFNPRITIAFELADAGRVSCQIFDVGGRLVRTLHIGEMAAGLQTLTWEGRDDGGDRVASGVYLVHTLHRGVVSTAKVILAK